MTKNKSGILQILAAICVLFLAGCSNSAQMISHQNGGLGVYLTELKQPIVTTEFSLDTQSLQATQIVGQKRRILSTIKRYAIDNGQLTENGHSLTKATEILAQSTVDGEDFVALREEYNSLGGPLDILLFFGSHPVQVSRIAVVKIVGRKVVARAVLINKENSYHWKAVFLLRAQ